MKEYIRPSLSFYDLKAEEKISKVGSTSCMTGACPMSDGSCVDNPWISPSGPL